MLNEKITSSNPLSIMPEDFYHDTLRKDFIEVLSKVKFDPVLTLTVEEVMNKADEVVNLSPIRWLQDPLAEMKGNRADYGRFADIRSKITSLEVVDGKEANGLFGIDTLLDLGIYYLTGEGGFDTKNFWKQFKNKHS